MKKIFIVALALPAFAFSYLGGSSESIESDRKMLDGTTTQIPTTQPFKVYEIKSDSTEIRQYVANGKVFAVTWAGGRHAELKQILGSKWDTYKKALNAARRNLGARQSRTIADGLVVEMWGHQRHLQGRAYLPLSLPAGVEVHALD